MWMHLRKAGAAVTYKHNAPIVYMLLSKTQPKEHTNHDMMENILRAVLCMGLMKELVTHKMHVFISVCVCVCKSVCTLTMFL